MDSLKSFLTELTKVDDTLELFCRVVDWLRPGDETEVDVVAEKIRRLALAMEAHPELAAVLVHELKVQDFDLYQLALSLCAGTGRPLSGNRRCSRRVTSCGDQNG